MYAGIVKRATNTAAPLIKTILAMLRSNRLLFCTIVEMEVM